MGFLNFTTEMVGELGILREFLSRQIPEYTGVSDASANECVKSERRKWSKAAKSATIVTTILT
jgi:hypothetical protein